MTFLAPPRLTSPIWICVQSLSDTLCQFRLWRLCGKIRIPGLQAISWKELWLFNDKYWSNELPDKSQLFLLSQLREKKRTISPDSIAGRKRELRLLFRSKQVKKIVAELPSIGYHLQLRTQIIQNNYPLYFLELVIETSSTSRPLASIPEY